MVSNVGLEPTTADQEARACLMGIGTAAHAVWLTFIVLVVKSLKNASELQLHQFRAGIESKMLMDKLGIQVRRSGLAFQDLDPDILAHPDH
jgi:hypothetical protein